MTLDLDRTDWPLDSKGMLAAIQEKADLLARGYEAGKAAGEPMEPDGLLFAGMGFSGVSADLVRDACSRALEVPFSIVRHYQFPHHVKAGWHCLSVSYSGETEETVSLTRTASERGVAITSFSTGGTVSELADRNVPQPPGYQPRAALGYAWFSILGFLEGAGVLPGPVPVAGAVEAVRAMDAANGPYVDTTDNEAKQLAGNLWDKIPQIYATPAMYGVGKHFRGMLNENAKKIADVDLVPECNHNDFSGWGDDPNREHFTCLALSHGNQHHEIAKRLEWMGQRYQAWGVPWHHHVFDPIDTWQEHIVQQAGALQLLDYTSFYTAMLRGVDPSEIREITGLKEYLRG